MTITIYNNFRATISAMIEWFHPNCPDGGDWEKMGWWVIEPQQTAIVWRGNHNAVNRFWYGYVFSVDGSQWTGDFPETVPFRAFRWCEHTADSTSRRVRMFERDAHGSGPNWVWMFGNVVQ